MSLKGEEALVLGMNYTEESLQGAGALKGEKGKSAYEVAVDNGFDGTEEEWLASLKGEKGDSGAEYDDTEIKNAIAELPTKDYVADEIANAQLGGDVDLSKYATKEYVDEALKDVDVDLTGYATETFVTNKIAEIDIPSTDGLVTEESLNTTLLEYAKEKDIPTTLPASDVYEWAKASTKPTYTAEEVGADNSGSSAKALSDAKEYTDEKIDTLVGDGASATLGTISEISKAIEEHQEVTDALNAAIGNKANVSDLTAHTSNTTVHITDTERTKWNEAEKNVIVGIQDNGTDLYVDPETRKVAITIPTKTSDLRNDSGFITGLPSYPAMEVVEMLQAPSFGDEIQVVDSITRNNNGAVTSITKSKITLPNEVFVKSGSSAKAGLVPAPSTTAGTNKYLREDGTWVSPPGTASNPKLGQGYAAVSNGTETAITASISSYTLATGGRVTIKFQNKVPANATLNINSKGAKPIYYDNKAITSNVIEAGYYCTFVYTGSAYELIDIYYGDGAGLMQAVAKSATSVPINPPQVDNVTSDFLSCSSTSLYRHSQSSVLAWIGANVDITGALTNLVANTPVDSVTTSEYYLSFASDGSPTSKVTLNNLQSTVANYIGLAPSGASGTRASQSVYPASDGSYLLGNTSYRWSTVYSSNGVKETSDRNKKTDIVSVDADKVSELIMGLNPVTFKFTDGTSGRTHYGLIAQEVEELLARLGIDTKDFAALDKSPKQEEIEVTLEDGTVTTELINVEGEYNYFLKYSEFIAPLIKMVQEQQKEIVELKSTVSELCCK